VDGWEEPCVGEGGEGWKVWIGDWTWGRGFWL